MAVIGGGWKTGALAGAGGILIGAAAVAGYHGLRGPDRAATEAIVRDYVLSHGEILPEAMNRMQQRQAASSVAQHRPALETPYHGGWAGAATATSCWSSSSIMPAPIAGSPMATSTGCCARTRASRSSGASCRCWGRTARRRPGSASPRRGRAGSARSTRGCSRSAGRPRRWSPRPCRRPASGAKARAPRRPRRARPQHRARPRDRRQRHPDLRRRRPDPPGRGRLRRAQGRDRGGAAINGGSIYLFQPEPDFRQRNKILLRINP